MRAACVSTWADDRKYFYAFMATAKRHGIVPFNADPEPWPGTDWKDTPWWRKSDAQARFVREHAGDFDVFLFCDAYDILFAAGWDEILSKFALLNSPIVFGAERYPWPKTEQAADYPPCPYPTRYLNAGMWIAKTEAALQLATVLAERAKAKVQCDQGICVDLFLSKQLPIALDTSCALLYCCNLDSMDHLSPEPPQRIRSNETGQLPCLFHGNGNANLSRLFPMLNL